MYLINEVGGMVSTPTNIKSIGKDRIRCECCIQTMNTINRNKRRYNKQLMKETIETITPRIKSGGFVGELDHPIDQNPVRQMTVQYKNTSHRFMEMWFDDNKLMSIVETLRTPNGEILKNLAEDGVPVGWSFRGMGELKQVTEGASQFFDVQGPMHAITWDSVSYPSHEGAEILKIHKESFCNLMESVTYTEENGIIKTNEGYLYLPDEFDKLVNTKVIKLKNKYTFYDF